MWLLLLSGCNKLGEEKRRRGRKEGREVGRDCLSFIISIVIYRYGHAAALKIYQFIMRYSAFYEEERQKERTTTTSSGEKATADNINKTRNTKDKNGSKTNGGKHERTRKNLRNPRLIRSFVYEMCV